MSIRRSRISKARRRRTIVAILAAVGQVVVLGALVLLLPAKACGDEVIPVGQLCPAGHRYEPLRLAGPRWVGLCYKGDVHEALASVCRVEACAREGLRTLHESVEEGNHVGAPSYMEFLLEEVLYEIRRGR